MIPKIIHYCWFGRNPKPKLAEKCIKSWKKYCPDYKIIEWNEDNFDIDTSPLYVRQDYEAKKWAFVTDYVRLWAMTEFGGIYMDTDVQVIKPLDRYLEHQAFSGFEDDTHVPTGIMACEKGFPLFKQFLEFYNGAAFTINTQTNVTTITSICLEKGLLQNNTKQTVEGFTIYPKDVFCPISYNTGKLEKTRNTATIHWFAASWHTKEQEEQRVRQKKQLKKDKRKTAIHNVIHIPNRILISVLGVEKYETFKKKVKG